MIGSVPDRLYFTSSEEANALIASDPLALLVGFVLDQQVSVPKAFAGPLALRERLGAFDAPTLASADLEPVFRARPAIQIRAASPPRWRVGCRIWRSTFAINTTATRRGSGPRRPTPRRCAPTWPLCLALGR